MYLNKYYNLYDYALINSYYEHNNCSIDYNPTYNGEPVTGVVIRIDTRPLSVKEVLDLLEGLKNDKRVINLAYLNSKIIVRYTTSL